MPTLVRWPGQVPTQQNITSPSASCDWAATFLEAAGGLAPARMDGTSLLPSLTGEEAAEDKVVYVEYFQKGTTPAYAEFNEQHRNRPRNQMQMIRGGELAGVRYDIQSAEDDFEIYNVVEDPEEVHNLAGQAGMDTLQQWMKDRVLQMRRPDAEAPRPYDEALVPAIPDQPVRAGVSWKVYSGTYPWIPQTTRLEAEASGRAERPDAKAVNFQKDGLVCFEGYLRVPADGAYTFYLKADSRAFLRIHEAAVIDADYGYDGEERTGDIPLKAGLHPFRLYYASQATAEGTLPFAWSGPGIAKQPVPAEVFGTK